MKVIKLDRRYAGFPDWKSTLQFEWRWKQLSRKQSGRPLQKRFAALHQLLGLPKSTSKAIPFYKYPNPLEITIERTM